MLSLVVEDHRASHSGSGRLSLFFCGATRQVTGSSHTLILESGKKILLDYGLFQGKRAEAAELNRSCELKAKEYDAVILSHAHIDHSGRLPAFVKQGFNGPIFSTDITKDLCSFMLLDSAKIQLQDSEYFTRKAIPTPIPIEPLYSEEDVMKTLLQFRGQAYRQSFQINDEVTCTFLEAGHVFGSSIVKLDIRTRRGKKILLYSGDLGRYGSLIIRDPDVVSKADYLICEGTYGDRVHEDSKAIDEELAQILRETFRRGGKVIIPAFALERTQEMVVRLQHLFNRGAFPKVPIFVDSPMASEVTQVFLRHPEAYDMELQRELSESGLNPFSEGIVKYTASVEESKALNRLHGPAIIISASGMCEEGRIRHHLANTLEDPKNSILIVGYQAKETLGRKLVDGVQSVSIFKKEFRVRATIKVFEGFSAHADKDDLDAFIKNIQGLRQVFLVHGEAEQLEAFGDRITQFSKAKVFIPSRGDSFKLW